MFKCNTEATLEKRPDFGVPQYPKESTMTSGHRGKAGVRVWAAHRLSGGQTQSHPAITYFS